MTAKFDELVSKLKEIFQLDKPELDFGVYRIMHTRAKEITEFLEKRLAEKVRTALAGNSAAEKAVLENELAAAIKNAQELGADPDMLPKVKELKDKIAALGGDDDAEASVYSHLLAFFSRYYDDGDFISKRRYKDGVYAIPYSGEEVKLHWANADQYYIKSGENFQNYDFSLDGGAKVHFKLVTAETAKDNIKDNEAVRCFVLWNPESVNSEEGIVNSEEDREPLPDKILEEKDGELYIYFQYLKFKKGTKQADFTKKAIEKIAQELGGELLAKYPIFAPAPTEKDKKRTVLEKHFTTYTEKNTSDYFIHKDLGGFLRRELDFYIKNEMMHLDDIQNIGAFKEIEKNLRQIQAVRMIADELITFMAQLEDFQKKLWLKKKFVTQCDYCLTMDLVPKELHAEVFANAAQQEEWKKLGFPVGKLVDAKSSSRQKQGEFNLGDSAAPSIDGRMVDTKFFDETFKAKLLASIPDIDEKCGGLLVHSDNFQALNFLQGRYRKSCSGIHIDPPYNTDTSGFLYKNNYRHSSWLTMIDDRVRLAFRLMGKESSFMCHIDENEYERLKVVLDSYPLVNPGTLIWDKRNPMTGGGGIAKQHEYVICRTNYDGQLLVKSENAKLMLEAAAKIISQAGGVVTDDARKKYSKWVKENDQLTGGEKAYVYIDSEGKVYSSVSLRAPEPRTDEKFHQPLIHPVTKKPCPVPPNGFSRTPDTLKGMVARGEILFGVDESTQPRQKRILTLTAERQINSVVIEAKKGKSDLEPMGLDFPYCHAVEFYDGLVSTMSRGENSVVLDYFGGSGTSAHAVIDLNRKDAEDNNGELGNRKYILVEMGDHFDTVLKPRIEKVVYSPDWKDGKPVSSDKGISHCFKYLTLESYEDALNNIELENKGELLSGAVKDEYLLGYMLDVESKGSIINTDDFRHPFDYRLKIAVDSSGASEKRKVDLVETFNYLIGLRIAQYVRELAKGYAFLDGTLPNGEKAFVLWRDCDKVNDAELNKLLAKLNIKPGATEYDVIYVNGDHAIANVSLGETAAGKVLKVRQIENEFLGKMFAAD